MSRTWRPMSRSRPTPCEAIAARSSGASAIRSISFWASSEASSRSQTWSTSCESSTLTAARSTAGLERVRSNAACASSDSSTRTIARSTAGLSSARTIASSVAVCIASSIPVADATRSAPRAPIPSSRAGSGGRRGGLAEPDITTMVAPGAVGTGLVRAAAGAQQTTARLNASVGLLVTTSTAFGKPAPANPAETGAGGVPAVVAATGTQPSML